MFGIKYDLVMEPLYPLLDVVELGHLLWKKGVPKKEDYYPFGPIPTGFS